MKKMQITINADGTSDIDLQEGFSGMSCVEKSKEGYSAVGTLDDAAQKFDFYSRMCKSPK